MEKPRISIPATPNSTPVATPRVSMEVVLSSPSVTATKSGSSNSTEVIVTNTQEQMLSLIRGADNTHRSTTPNPPVVGKDKENGTSWRRTEAHGDDEEWNKALNSKPCRE